MGVLTYFVRTVGCNLSCSWCDTGYSNEGGTEMTVSEVLDLVKDDKSLCVTGGEPLLQKDMPQLLEGLCSADKITVLETNGSVSLENVPQNKNMIISMDIKCPSSGMTDKMLISNLKYLKSTDQLKFVINDRTDLDFAEKFIVDNPTEANIIFSPVGGMELLPLAEEIVSKKLNVRVLPQLHKIIWGDKRSV